MTAGALLDAQHVRKTFGGLVAVRDVSFAIMPGEVVGLIGPNGSGKTTLINLISGVLAADSGAMRLGDRDMHGTPAHHRAGAGIARTFQLVRVAGEMTALENAEAGLVCRGDIDWGEESRREAARLLALAGLEGKSHIPASDLTYGDQKRVELARALASDPKVLLLDEWLAGLNPTELKTGIALIEQLRAEGRTIIVVEHVMHAIRSLCDRCVVMNSGAKIAEGTPQQVLADGEVIRAYLGDADA
jgi:branched-chain amino acid transport system ATP-binding protein